MFVRSLVPFFYDPNGILCEPLEYEEVARVCPTLKLGVSGVEIDYEHIRYAGPPLWKLLYQLYQNYFDNFSVCDSLLTGVILQFSKVKVPKLITKITTGVLHFSLIFVKSLRWFPQKIGKFC